MQYFHYQRGRLLAESVELNDVAEKYGTPSYIYSRQAIVDNWHNYANAFKDRNHLICYAVKANSNLAVLNILAKLNSGFDIVSVGELERVLKAGGNPEKIVFSGVGKRRDEMKRALQVGIKCFNVESTYELIQLNAIAQELNVLAPVSIRVNPDVDPNTHPYIATGLKYSKFGIPADMALQIYTQAAMLENINIKGIDCHIGSQVTDKMPYLDAVNKLLELVNELEQNHIEVQHIDVGGGLGIPYVDENPPPANELVESICEIIPAGYEILIEPGRSIVGNAGVLLTRVIGKKINQNKNFIIVDAAMNDLLRPALYDAEHDIKPVIENTEQMPDMYDIVGPVCESGDFLGLERNLMVSEGDLLAVCSAGAYAFTMSSNYNSRPRAAELLVAGDDMHEIRSRERIEELFRDEKILPG